MLPNREQVHTHTFSWEEKLQNKNKLFSIGNLKEQYITKIFHMLKENITVTESVRWGSDAITYLLGSLSAKQWAIKLHMILLLCKSLFICHIWQVLFVSYLFLPQENKIIIIKKKSLWYKQMPPALIWVRLSSSPQNSAFGAGDNLLRTATGSGSCGTTAAMDLTVIIRCTKSSLDSLSVVCDHIMWRKEFMWNTSCFWVDRTNFTPWTVFKCVILQNAEHFGPSAAKQVCNFKNEKT